MSPFGGYKHSGLGRESGQDAIYEYLQTKSVWLNFAEEAPQPLRDRLRRPRGGVARNRYRNNRLSPDTPRRRLANSGPRAAGDSDMKG